MCFSPEVSMTTFIIVSVSCIYIYLRNYPSCRPLTFILFTVGLMQLAEFFIWKDQNCGRQNHLATLIAFVILCLQPIVLMLIFYFYKLLKINYVHLSYLVVIYILFFVFFIINSIFNNTSKLCSKSHKNLSYLVWGYDPVFKNIHVSIIYLFWCLYFIAPFLFFLSKNLIVGIGYFSLLAFCLLVSVFFTRGFSSLCWKSLWCLLVNLIPIIIILVGEIYLLQQRKKKKK